MTRETPKKSRLFEKLLKAQVEAEKLKKERAKRLAQEEKLFLARSSQQSAGGGTYFMNSHHHHHHHHPSGGIFSMPSRLQKQEFQSGATANNLFGGSSMGTDLRTPFGNSFAAGAVAGGNYVRNSSFHTGGSVLTGGLAASQEEHHHNTSNNNHPQQQQQHHHQK